MEMEMEMEMKKGRDWLNIHLSKKKTENGEGAEKDDKDVGEKREKGRIAVSTVIVNQRPNYQTDYCLSCFAATSSIHRQFAIAFFRLMLKLYK